MIAKIMKKNKEKNMIGKQRSIPMEVATPVLPDKVLDSQLIDPLNFDIQKSSGSVIITDKGLEKSSTVFSTINEFYKSIVDDSPMEQLIDKYGEDNAIMYVAQRQKNLSISFENRARFLFLNIFDSLAQSISNTLGIENIGPFYVNGEIISPYLDISTYDNNMQFECFGMSVIPAIISQLYKFAYMKIVDQTGYVEINNKLASTKPIFDALYSQLLFVFSILEYEAKNVYLPAMYPDVYIEQE